MTLRQYQQDLTPLRGEWGQRWAGAFGQAKDDLLERARQAVLAGAIQRTPPDGLPRLGADAAIERAPGEEDDAYRLRIADAFESWSWAGTKYGISTAVGLLGRGYPSVWSYREVPPDANATRWARVSIIFRGLPAWDGAVVWDGDDTWDSLRHQDAVESADPATLRSQLRRVTRKWINARDVCDHVTVAFGGLLWDVDALWDGADVWDEGDGETTWGAPEWDTGESGVEWDSPLCAWDAFC